MRNTFYLIICLAYVSSCKVKEIEPDVFENYFLDGNAVKKYFDKDFIGDYVIKEAWFNDVNNINISTNQTKLSLTKDNKFYYLDFPLYNSNSDQKFHIRTLDFEINNYIFDVAPRSWDYTDKTGKVVVVASGKLNQQDRSISLKVDYYYLLINENSVANKTPKWTKSFILNYLK